MSKHNARKGCPSARTIHKHLMRGVRGRSRTSIKVCVPLSAYPDPPPVFSPPGKQLWSTGWQLPNIDGREATVHINNMSANFDPRLNRLHGNITPYVTKVRDYGHYKCYDYFECVEHTERDGDVVSIRDADPAILAAYLKREAWFDRYVYGTDEHGTELVEGQPWIEAISGAVYGWYTKGTSHDIVGDHLVFDATVKSCYLSRVRAFSRELAAAIRVCADYGVRIRMERGERW